MKNPWENFTSNRTQNNNTKRQQSQSNNSFGWTQSQKPVVQNKTPTRWNNTSNKNNNQNNTRWGSSWNNNQSNNNTAPPMYQGAGDLLPTYHGPQMFVGEDGELTPTPPNTEQHFNLMVKRAGQIGFAHFLGHLGQQMAFAYLNFNMKD